MPDIVSHMGPFLIRTFDIGKGQAARDRQLATGSPVLTVLGTDADEPLNWMQAGQAVARILLRARADNIWASFMNQPILECRSFEVARSNGQKCGVPTTTHAAWIW